MNYTMNGVRGYQFGRNTYQVNIPYIQLNTICEIDPEVQRKVDYKKVKNISKYILDTITGKKPFGAFNALSCSLRNALIEEYKDAMVSFSSSGKLYIHDGQHRFLAIRYTIEYVKSKMEDAKMNSNQKLFKYWNAIMEELSQYTMPVLIFDNLAISEEAQLFYDYNYLASPVTSSQALKLDSSDKYNIMAKELELEIPEINILGINKTNKNLPKKSNEFATLAVWNQCIRIILNGYQSSKQKTPWNDKWNYLEKKEMVKKFWISLFEVLPTNFHDREKYIVSKSVVLLGISAWAHQLLFSENINWKDSINKLSNYDWSYTNSIYSAYGGGAIVKDRFQFTGTRSAVKSIPLTLKLATK